MSDQVQPIYILPEGTQRQQGRSAQSNNIMAAKLVAETVRTTLGPRGMDKMIVDSLGDVIVTNDGVTILKEMQIEHPSAKMIVEIAKTQEDEVGDGTTTAVVLAGEFLKRAESLIEQKIHPTVIAKGYRLATAEAIKFLNEDARSIQSSDRDILKKVSMTAMTGKGAESNKEKLAEISIDAINSVDALNLDHIKIETKIGGSVIDSELVKGVIIDKERVHSQMPSHIENAKIALIDSPIEIRDTETDAKISITDPSQLQSFIDMEEQMIKNMVNKIVKSGANVLLCQKGIDDIAQHFLSKHNILAVRRVKKSDMESLSRATDANIITNLDDLTESDLGYGGLVEEKKVGDELMIFVTQCKNPKSVTILVRGGTEHVVDEIKRALDDSLGVLAATLKDGKCVAGAGSTEMRVSKHLREFSNTLSGREQLAVNAFAESLEVIPKTLAENAGLDPIDVITQLKNGDKNIGINVFTGKIMDAWESGVIEPLRIKTQAISSASEVAVMILRIDDVILGQKNDVSNPQPPMM